MAEPPPPDLMHGRWRWNGREWVPSDLPLDPSEPQSTAPAEPATIGDLVAESKALLGEGRRGRVVIGSVAGAVVLVVALIGFTVALRINNAVNPPTGPSAKQIVAAAADQVRTTFSYHMVANSSDDGSQVEISQQDQTSVEISSSQGGLTASMISADGRTYIQGNSAFFDKFSPGLAPLAGRWMITPLDSSLVPLQAVESFRESLSCSLSAPIPWRLAADTEVAGQPAHHVYVAGGGNRVDLYIAAAGPAYLLRAVVAIKIPDQTLAYHPAAASSCTSTGSAGQYKPGTSVHWTENFDTWGGDVRVGVPSEPITLVNRPTTQ